MTKTVILLFAGVFYSSFAEDSKVSDFEKVLAQSTGAEIAVEPEAKSELKIGTLDLGLVQLFHPRMQDFNFMARSFLRPVPKDFKGDSRAYFVKRQEAYKLHRDAHSDKISNLENLKRRIEAEILWEKSHLNKKINDRNRDFASKPEQLAQEIKKVEDEAWKKILELNQKLEQASSEYETWVNQNIGENFMIKKDRDGILSQIASEIQSAVKQVCQAGSLDLAVDSGVSVKRSSLNVDDSRVSYRSLDIQENALGKLLGELGLADIIKIRESDDEAYKIELGITENPALCIEEESIDFRDVIFQGIIPEKMEIKSLITSIV